MQSCFSFSAQLNSEPFSTIAMSPREAVKFLTSSIFHLVFLWLFTTQLPFSAAAWQRLFYFLKVSNYKQLTWTENYAKLLKFIGKICVVDESVRRAVVMGRIRFSQTDTGDDVEYFIVDFIVWENFSQRAQKILIQRATFCMFFLPQSEERLDENSIIIRKILISDDL